MRSGLRAERRATDAGETRVIEQFRFRRSKRGAGVFRIQGLMRNRETTSEPSLRFRDSNWFRKGAVVGWTILGVIVGVVVVDLAIRAFYVRLILPQFEAKPPFNVSPHPPDTAAESVSTITSDGVVLRGRLYRGSESRARGLILFCPELD